jgi:alanyl-tRNA synthetase
MLTKQGLKQQFAKEWKKHYQIGLFRDKGFMRKECPHCGQHFWTLDPDRKSCGTPPCENYGFIGKPITKVKWDYVTAWKAFEKFFKKNAHTSVPRYPVIDRWRPDLYFTIASIQDFQRIDSGSVVMEYPADPLVVPQVCLRFNDIENVGVTGRHHTSFIMPGQHSFGNYWKDRTIELNFRFINQVMGVPEREITYLEDMWSMPDFSQFGPSLETFSRGLELVNSVFSQFTASSPIASSYKDLPHKVVDVGWGHERLVWFSNGTTTGYDAVFEPVIKWMMKKTGIKETSLFNKYSVLAGSLTVDEVKDMAKMREKVAREIGVSVKELNSIVEPMQALYAIADHAKTLLFAVTDGGIPSNVGGGYNLRVVLRRSLSFMEDHKFDFGLEDIAELHAKQLRSMFPELGKGLDPLSKVLDVESRRYKTTAKKAISIVQKELTKGARALDEKALIRLYTSNGIAPEDVQHIAKEKGIEIKAPEEFYTKITEQHMANEKAKEEAGKEALKLNISGLKATRRIYYEKPYQQEFKAKVVKVLGDWVILDQTCFYPEGGGQPADKGRLIVNGRHLEVKDVQKIGTVVVHKVPRSGLKPGQDILGKIDWEHRYALMKMHTSTHVLAGVARQIIGGHIWQAGAQKGRKASRLDLTHYERFSQEELKRIEKIVNSVIMKGIPVSTKFYPRKEAEAKYGFVLYQGGASPGKDVRVVSVKGLDVEACGGTHLANTKEIGTFKIIRAERIQDGVNRIEFATSDSAERVESSQLKIFTGTGNALINISNKSKYIKTPKDISGAILYAANELSVEPAILQPTVEKFGDEIKENQKKIDQLSDELDLKVKKEDPLKSKPKTLPEAVKNIFNFWKTQKKEIERMTKEKAKKQASLLVSKAKNNRISDIVKADRKELIAMAGDLINQNPKLTVVLANPAGDVVGMSKTEDMAKTIQVLCKKAGGSGGGKPGFAQGKADPSKLVKMMK